MNECILKAGTGFCNESIIFLPFMFAQRNSLVKRLPRGVAVGGERGDGSWERYLRAEKRRNSRIYIEAVGGDGRRAPSVSEKETHSYRV